MDTILLLIGQNLYKYKSEYNIIAEYRNSLWIKKIVAIMYAPEVF
jgi:hypothetical protein